MKYLVIIAILSLILVSCSNTNKKHPDTPPNIVYQTAKQKMQDCNWRQAIVQLETLYNNYFYSPDSQRIQLDLIYAYYKNADFMLALTTIDRFIRFNPTHPNIDYVIYMRGLSNMAIDDNAMQRFFRVDRSDRDPKYAFDAFNDFYKLMMDYPDSLYVTDTMKRMIFLQNRLARYEYSVASYYARRGAWIAVINRVETMLKDYPNTQATYDGLKLMEKAYYKMHMDTQANKVATIINLNSNH